MGGNMSIKTTIAKYGLGKMIDQLYEDPQKGMQTIMSWADKFSRGEFVQQREVFRKIFENEDDPYNRMIRKMLTDIDRSVFEKILVNFFVNANLAGWPVLEENRKKYNCNVPWAILLDPTSACNLHCTGCWAAEYGNKLNLSYDEIDDIITQGKELGVYFYIYTGGEPLVRKKDLIKICEKHDDCVFLSFTNGTLIDEEFADDMLRVGNFVPAISGLP